MKKLFSLELMLGFLFVDFLFFHDVFKPGEITSFSQYLTGVLSIPVIIISLKNLVEHKKQVKSS